MSTDRSIGKMITAIGSVGSVCLHAGIAAGAIGTLPIDGRMRVRAEGEVSQAIKLIRQQVLNGKGVDQKSRDAYIKLVGDGWSSHSSHHWSSGNGGA